MAQAWGNLSAYLFVPIQMQSPGQAIRPGSKFKLGRPLGGARTKEAGSGEAITLCYA